MTINVIYCNLCSPKKVLATGPGVSARHWLADETLHDDSSLADINIVRNEGESAQAFHERIEANHQADMV